MKPSIEWGFSNNYHVDYSHGKENFIQWAVHKFNENDRKLLVHNTNKDGLLVLTEFGEKIFEYFNKS